MCLTSLSSGRVLLLLVLSLVLSILVLITDAYRIRPDTFLQHLRVNMGHLHFFLHSLCMQKEMKVIEIALRHDLYCTSSI